MVCCHMSSIEPFKDQHRHTVWVFNHRVLHHSFVNTSSILFKTKTHAYSNGLLPQELYKNSIEPSKDQHRHTVWVSNHRTWNHSFVNTSSILIQDQDTHI